METQNIKQLEICPKKDWAIKVTVSRKWRRIPINNQTIGLNLILIDQTDRIHAWMNSTLMHRLEDKFVENYTLLLSNFIVKKYIKSENFKCFKAEHYICLTPFTTVSVLEPVLPGAYPHLFDCVAFSTFPENGRQRKYLIDVVGIVESVKPIYHVMNRSAFRKDFIRFVVRDLHNATAHVVFENGLAHAFNVAMMEANEKPAVVIIASCRIRMLGDVLGFVHNVQGINRFINRKNVEHSFLNLVLSSTEEKRIPTTIAASSMKRAKAREKYPEENMWSRQSSSQTSSETEWLEPQKQKTNARSFTLKVDIAEDKFDKLGEKIEHLSVAIERLIEVIQLSQYSWKDNAED
ncbi:hypothetical protein DCAR_0623457 [Daucus carota subsp. sativus]|uniref:Replication protein A 70 kDa DNA-binding subunit B/D first OB fold domain-containing protein n=1 Tax=Daucus carota subsp. sativus TaxID=79200 RepID=A0AAF0XBL1_DAUCS|nr:hypothetical protein DCAR_0623457 [Daucus carota subsp. sativus]